MLRMVIGKTPVCWRTAVGRQTVRPFFKFTRMGSAGLSPGGGFLFLPLVGDLFLGAHRR